MIKLFSLSKPWMAMEYCIYWLLHWDYHPTECSQSLNCCHICQEQLLCVRTGLLLQCLCSLPFFVAISAFPSFSHLLNEDSSYATLFRNSSIFIIISFYVNVYLQVDPLMTHLRCAQIRWRLCLLFGDVPVQ